MSSKNSYKTVAREAQTLLVREKSKFITHVMPVDNEPDAVSYLNKIRSEYPDARHNVYAYVIDENNIFRYSDDGEPSGTAGMPVLDAIRKRGIVDVIVVVTRYFGGVLLGTGGLVHAYGQSASDGLKEAGIVERRLCDIINIKVDYSLVGKMQYLIASNGYTLEDTVYDNEVTFTISCPIEDTKRVISQITELTNARAQCTLCAQKYTDKETDE
ncbi:MAG: YigZ family protein [Clostridiales bacterium]|nr:YigZ family protein [Clostridiales bacterium]